jgi:hypothetical protein
MEYEAGLVSVMSQDTHVDTMYAELRPNTTRFSLSWPSSLHTAYASGDFHSLRIGLSEEAAQD